MSRLCLSNSFALSLNHSKNLKRFFLHCCFDVQEEISYKEDLARTILSVLFIQFSKVSVRPSLSQCAFLSLSVTAKILYTCTYHHIKTKLIIERTRLGKRFKFNMKRTEEIQLTVTSAIQDIFPNILYMNFQTIRDTRQD